MRIVLVVLISVALVKEEVTNAGVIANAVKQSDL